MDHLYNRNFKTITRIGSVAVARDVPFIKKDLTFNHSVLDLGRRYARWKGKLLFVITFLIFIICLEWSLHGQMHFEVCN